MGYKKVKNAAILGIIILLFSGFFPGKEDLYFEITKNIDLFSKVYKEISFNYVDDVNPEQFMRAGIVGMLNSLDPYTVFIDENKKDEIELITNGKYGGIGITIGVRGNRITVVEVLEGYSAQRQGLRVGDVIIEAGGVILSPDNMDNMSTLVKGEPGTAVEMRVLRNEEKDTVKFNLVREEISIKNVTYYGFYPENSGNAYIKLSNFSRSAGDEVKRALKELKSRREISSIVLDLRGNPGGLLDVAVDIADKFLSKDMLIVTTKGRTDASERKYYSVQEPMLGTSQLVVLVNEGTASASEIVAGAIQDHDRGIILGSKSFGKGLVQTITPLNFNTSLKITTAKYYTPSGRCIQKIDYSKKNNVIADVDSIIAASFLTDNKRTVYSAGGISPDTTVVFEVQGELTKELLAKGLFFRFSDSYYYKNIEADYSSTNSEKLFNEFVKYIDTQDFHYKSEAEKQIEKLLEDVKAKKLEQDLTAELLRIKAQLEKLDKSEMKVYKDEIIREIRGELALRYLGSEGKIKELLKYDLQFQAAIKLLNNEKSYLSLLNSN
ncbi:MAG: S41 family peptidase [Ignavibacteriaceae bacterium]